MMKLSKLSLLGLGFVSLGVLCGIAENALYGGRLDSNGVIQESLFLPLTFVFLAIGAAFLLTAVLKRFFQKTV